MQQEILIQNSRAYDVKKIIMVSENYILYACTLEQDYDSIQNFTFFSKIKFTDDPKFPKFIDKSTGYPINLKELFDFTIVNKEGSILFESNKLVSDHDIWEKLLKDYDVFPVLPQELLN
jgi:hypothetical protein